MDSKYSVSMQRHQSESNATTSTDTRRPVSLNHSISLKGINEKDLQILIAEDNDSNCSLVKHILKEYQITRVVNELEATENQGAESYHPHYRTYRQCLRC